MKYVVDTNVPVAANGRSEQVSADCMARCARWLVEIQGKHVLVLDDGWHILTEYQENLRSAGQPGPGDAFFRWVLTNRENRLRCRKVHITCSDVNSDRLFIEFPDDSRLVGFDRSDQKFVAVALARKPHPIVLNATDSDWWNFREALGQHGLQIEFVCPDARFQW